MKVLQPKRVWAPNVACVTGERHAAFGDDTGAPPGPPDLAVEITSPNDSPAQVHTKAADYLAAGTGSCGWRTLSSAPLPLPPTTSCWRAYPDGCGRLARRAAAAGLSPHRREPLRHHISAETPFDG